jgi:hypothetical protein
VRGGDVVDDELIAIVKDRVARNDHPTMWITPSLHSAWMMAAYASTPNGQKPAWLDDPLLRATYPAQQIDKAFSEDQKPAIIKRHLAEEVAQQGRNAMALRAAGMRIVMGTDTGQTRHWIGYYNHMALESYVAIGMTPMEAIVGSTRDSAEIAGLDTGLVAAGKSADFTVLDASPLERIANSRRISSVYLRGQEVPRAALAAKWQAQFNQAASTR